MKLRPLVSRINIWFLYVLFTLIVAAVILYSVFLIQELRARETKRIQVFAKAMKIQQTDEQMNSDTQDLLFTIFTENDQLPMIVTDADRNPIMAEGYYRNIPADVATDEKKMKLMAENMAKNYQPFQISIANSGKQYLYYDNSQLMNNIRYYPYFLGFFILSYLIFSLWLLRTVKKTDEGFVWAGLAKETAHQIGTPLSSMIGWIEIMKLEDPSSMGVTEIEQDINRLKTISERFSKIGSVPELKDMDLEETVRQNFEYLKSRISTKVKFSLNISAEKFNIAHNRILFSWVIENLVKNAVDAMKGMGELQINLYRKNKNIYIDFKDNGCGMTAAQARNVFKPGYSTKKRGWGLGLSLSRRVIKEYHHGEIRIAQTEIGKGTTFRIILRPQN